MSPAPLFPTTPERRRPYLESRAVWCSDRYEAAMDRLQARRFERRVYVDCEGREFPDSIEEAALTTAAFCEHAAREALAQLAQLAA